MLSIEHQEVIKGYTVFRDFSNESQYYYLPDDKVKIAKNGKGIQYVVYTDGEVLEGDSPDFDKDQDRVGGFLTLEVELGPNEEEIEELKSELESKVGSQVRLAQAPFKDGKVSLVMFGQEGNGAGEGSSGPVSFTVAGSAKPSLFGRQTAVFSLRLGGREAQIMWNLLKEGSQTQIGIVYDLDFLGVMPAYHLEIIVDFKATENFWNHKFNASLEVGNEQHKVIASADVDWMVRELINEGSIVVKQVVYSEGERDTNPLGDDPTAIELVKKLMAPTLFNATAIPSSDYTAVTEEVINRQQERPADADGDPPVVDSGTPGQPIRGAGADDDRKDRPVTPPGTGTGTGTGPGTGTGTGTGPGTGTGTGTGPGTGTGTGTGPTGPGTGTGTGTGTGPGTGTGTGTGPGTGTGTGPKTGTGTGTGTGSGKEPPAEDTDKSDIGVNVNIGYSLKRREITEKVKRRFVFDKAEAKVHAYHPGGALSLEDTAFDVDKQVKLVRLGEGPFKEIEIEARASFDFSQFAIREAIVHISYGFRGTKGDKSNRLHELSLTLSATSPRQFVKFFVDAHGTLSYDYFVEFIHEPGSIIGTHETKITSRLFENVTERDISINIDDHSPLVPVEIQVGNLQFTEDSIQSVQVFLAPEKGGNGRTTIMNAGSPTNAKYLVFPSKEDTPEYFKKELFFFQGETLTFEHEKQKDAQAIVNTPATRIFKVAPNLINTGNLTRQALVDVIYRNLRGEEKKTTLNLTPEESRREFSVLVEETDPRVWQGRTRFVLNDGRILEGDWIHYDIAEPLINLDNSGFRVIKMIALLGEATFSGTIAALEVRVFDPDQEALGVTMLLRSGKSEDQAIVPDVPVTKALKADVKIFRKDGTSETQAFIISPGTSEFLLPVTAIN